MPLRALRRSPGFAAAAVLSLALGLGANMALFSAVGGRGGHPDRRRAVPPRPPGFPPAPGCRFTD